MAHWHRTSTWLQGHILSTGRRVLSCLNLGVLPIFVGTALIGALVWSCAAVGWLMPAVLHDASISPVAKPPWFHDPESFAALSLTGLMALFLGSVATVLFLVITFLLGNWALRRKLDQVCKEEHGTSVADESSHSG